MMLRTAAAIVPRVRVQRWLAMSFGALFVATGVLQGAFGRMRSWYGKQEPLVVARCEVRCWSEDDKNACIRSCLTKGITKPGICPEKNDHLSPFDEGCMNTCDNDSQCRGITKCCQHFCGITCGFPINLDFLEGLPTTPKEPKVIEGRKKRTVQIDWSTADTNYQYQEPGKLLYLIEERHHAGKYFNSNLLSDWSPCAKSYKTSRLLKHFVKAGKWYQFRIAAVNENGTRGYSESTLPFRVSASPKPPKAPQNVTVGPLVKKNGSLNTIVKWSPVVSDLPIEKYKVFWSRRLQGAKALDSVLVHQQVLSKDTDHFLLQGLQPNSQYFLQVQGLVQYGKETLKGEKSGLVLNTTDFINEQDNALVLDEKHFDKIEALRLLKLSWNKGNLKARIVWNSTSEYSKYTITWWSTPCNGRINAFKHFKFSAVTKATYFDLFDLQFNCRYKVSVKKMSSEEVKAKHDTFVTFTTPSCAKFKRSHKKVKCT